MNVDDFIKDVPGWTRMTLTEFGGIRTFLNEDLGLVLMFDINENFMGTTRRVLHASVSFLSILRPDISFVQMDAYVAEKSPEILRTFFGDRKMTSLAGDLPHQYHFCHTCTKEDNL